MLEMTLVQSFLKLLKVRFNNTIALPSQEPQKSTVSGKCQVNYLSVICSHAFKLSIFKLAFTA